ncbi:hypothetical protein F511_30067 [Dorcoceras hygrometricum]|uniref:Uncharacterized protein n=1 Tax=Dorcoceras hygrometricum TaxID=472368 RepID=A0A2Z7D0I4_9LAMI|nr:hypothetical protein F511_30067 [Dorcoceras hygrometricum]
MFLVDWAVKMRIRPPEFETSICDAKYHVSLQTLTLSTKPPPPSLEYAAADRRRKYVSGQFDEENPFVLISSVLLVQPDEGISDLVVDRIGVNYRNLPRRAGFLKHRLEPGTSASKPGGGSGSANNCSTEYLRYGCELVLQLWIEHG